MRRALVVLAVAALLAGAAAIAFGGEKPDPNKQALADGCKRDKTGLYTTTAPNWVYVNDRDYPASGPPPPPQWASGTVDSRELPYFGGRVSSSDNPLSHDSFDVNVDLAVDPTQDWLTGASRDGTIEAGRLHLERETGFFAPFAWPIAGDRVTTLGSWVWDCDHFQDRGEKTEFHPLRAIWVERGGSGRPSPSSPRGESEGDLYLSSDGTPAAAQAECAHRTKGDSVAFHACLHSSNQWLDPSGDYSFQLSPPPGGSPRAQLVVRVVDRGSVNAPRVSAVWNDAVVKVSLHVAAKPGERVVVAKQVFAGWAGAKPPVHLRLHFDSILIRRAMDPSCAPDQPNCRYKDETTLLGQIAPAPGEWQITWSVDGIWGRWKPATLYARDGRSFPGGQSIDFSVPRGKPWLLLAEGRECDFGAVPSFRGLGIPVAPCPKTGEVGNSMGDDYGGPLVARFRSPEASLGRHSTDSLLAGSTCPPSNSHGCYRITYTVTRMP